MTIIKIIMTVLITLFVITPLLNAQDIFLSAEKGDLQTVRTILNRNPDAVKAKNNDGDTPLHIAALKGHIDIVKFLLTQNPDLEIKNNKGFTPLLYASWMFHRESRVDYRRIIELFLAHGAEANTTGDGGYNPLHWINHPSENNLTDILELNALFISKGVDVNAQNIYGSTPLHYAVHIHTKTAQILIKNNADVNVKDKQGRTPLFRISGFDHPEAASTVRLLINNGAMINTQDNNGKTAVERALANGRKDIADILISYQNNADIEEFLVLKGAYLGQKPPGMTPELFAPGIVPTEANEALYGFFNDGTLFLFDRTPADLEEWAPAVYRMELKDGKWTQPNASPYQGKPWYHYYTTAPEGEQVYFAWKGSLGDRTPSADLNIWRVRKTAEGWTEPRKLPSPVNSMDLDTYPKVTEDGTLYFFSNREGGFGGHDIYRSPSINGKHTSVENLGAPINTEFDELDPFIAPDESYLIFCSKALEGFGGFDLYVTFKKFDGTWTKPVNMGEGINTSAYDWVPHVTPDGKYFFFNSTRSGSWDIYWVDAKVIENLKPKELK